MHQILCTDRNALGHHHVCPKAEEWCCVCQIDLFIALLNRDVGVSKTSGSIDQRRADIGAGAEFQMRQRVHIQESSRVFICLKITGVAVVIHLNPKRQGPKFALHPRMNPVKRALDVEFAENGAGIVWGDSASTQAKLCTDVEVVGCSGLRHYGHRRGRGRNDRVAQSTGHHRCGKSCCAERRDKKALHGFVPFVALRSS